jgi:hypothetical protein
MADVLTDTGTREFSDGAGGVGRTAADDKTSLHCDWAASAGTAAKPSKRAKLRHIAVVPTKRRNGGRGNL